MITIEEIKDKIRTLLIEKDGDVQPHEWAGIISEAKEAGINDKQIAKLVPDVDRTINWEAIRAEKKAVADRIAATQQEEERKKQKRTDALKDVSELLRYCIDSGAVDTDELNIIFVKGNGWGLEDDEITKLVKSEFDKHHFKPDPKPDISLSGRDMFLSANWYGEKHFAQKAIYTTPPSTSKQQVVVEPPSYNPPKSGGGSKAVLIILGILAVVFVIYLIARNSGSSSYETTSNDTTSTMTADTAMSIAPDTSKMMSQPSNNGAVLGQHEPSSASSDTVAKRSDEDVNSEVTQTEKDNIASMLTSFYSYDNDGNIEQILNYFEYPVSYYYDKRYTNLSYGDLKAIYEKSFNETLKSHHISLKGEFTVQKNGDGFIVKLPANYQFTSEKYPDGKNRDILIVMNLTKDLKITRIYEL